MGGPADAGTGKLITIASGSGCRSRHLDRWSEIAGPVVIGIVVREALEAPVYPQVLLRHLANLRLDQMVVAFGVGYRAVAGKVVERRMDDGAVALRTGQALEEIGKYGCTRHAGEPRGEGVGCGRDTKQLDHLGAFLAITLVGRIPDAFVLFESLDHCADIVPWNRVPAEPGAAARQGPGEHLVPGRPIEEAGWFDRRQDAGTDLEGGEVSSEQDDALAASKRRLEMLAAFDFDDPPEPPGGCPPRAGRLQQ